MSKNYKSIFVGICIVRRPFCWIHFYLPLTRFFKEAQNAHVIWMWVDFLSLIFSYKYERALYLSRHLPRHRLANSTSTKNHEEVNKTNLRRNPHPHQSRPFNGSGFIKMIQRTKTKNLNCKMCIDTYKLLNSPPVVAIKWVVTSFKVSFVNLFDHK